MPTTGPTNGSDPKRLGPTVPRVHPQMMSTIIPTMGIKANKTHQPLRSRSCNLRTVTDKFGKNIAKPTKVLMGATHPYGNST